MYETYDVFQRWSGLEFALRIATFRDNRIQLSLYIW